MSDRDQVKRMRRNEMLVNTEFDVQKIESNFYATKSYYYLLFRPLMRLTWTAINFRPLITRLMKRYLKKT